MKKSKLLRSKRGDHQPEHAAYLARGGEPYRTLVIPDEAMNLVLIGKLHEEAEEIRENMQDRAEYADALQVLMDLALRNGVSWSDVEAMRMSKLQYTGGFTSPRIMIKD